MMDPLLLLWIVRISDKMKKDKDIVISRKLINILIFVFIILILYLLKIAFSDFLSRLYKVILPISASFLVAYIIYPTYKRLNNHMPKILSIMIIYLVIIVTVLVLISFLIPNKALISQITVLSSNIIKFISNISVKYNLDINVKDILLNKTNDLISHTVSLITNAIGVVLNILFILVLSIYFLISMDNIKKYMKCTFKKYIDVLKTINNELERYFHGVLIITFIQFVEYTIIYHAIGHPHYLLLGVLNAITSFMPMIGTLATGILALITASVISKKLFILTTIMIIILPNIDAYLVTPMIYKGSNKISAFVTILSVFVGGTLFGVVGMLLSIPFTIIMSIIFVEYKKRSIKSKNMI